MSTDIEWHRFLAAHTYSFFYLVCFICCKQLQLLIHIQFIIEGSITKPHHVQHIDVTFFEKIVIIISIFLHWNVLRPLAIWIRTKKSSKVALARKGHMRRKYPKRHEIVFKVLQISFKSWSPFFFFEQVDIHIYWLLTSFNTLVTCHTIRVPFLPIPI